jgi:DNA-binding response OmpR family regulator
MKLLIIEDEKSLSDSIKSYMESEHYLCEQAFTVAQGKMMAACYDYDCVLLDLMLPDGNGLDILKAVQQRGSDCGVIIISAKDSLDDKLQGLATGADDYLPKPFALPELAMRVYALIRRKRFKSHNTISSDGITIDLLTKTVTANGQPVVLTHSEYELLLFLISNKGRVLSKIAIAEHLSGEMADMMDNFDFVYSHVKNLKSKLAKAGVKGYLKTIYATGYKWIE